MRFPSFALMAAHGEGERQCLPAGALILSKLCGGSSRIIAHAPSVKFVLSGEEVYTVAGRTRRVRAGEFILVEAGTEFVARTAGSEPTIGMCVYLGSSALSEEGARAGAELASPIVSGTWLDPFAALLEGHARALSEADEVSGEIAGKVVESVTAGAFDFLARLWKQGERLGSVRRSTRFETLQRLERARAFIHGNAERPLALEEISAEAALSRFHLSRTFAEVYGSAPLAYHRSLRLAAAAERLRRGETSPTEISHELGYASLSGFTRAFHREFGVPPSRAGQLPRAALSN